jgi:hypothetical protein
MVAQFATVSGILALISQKFAKEIAQRVTA